MTGANVSFGGTASVCNKEVWKVCKRRTLRVNEQNSKVMVVRDEDSESQVKDEMYGEIIRVASSSNILIPPSVRMKSCNTI